MREANYRVRLSSCQCVYPSFSLETEYTTCFVTGTHSCKETRRAVGFFSLVGGSFNSELESLASNVLLSVQSVWRKTARLPLRLRSSAS